MPGMGRDAQSKIAPPVSMVFMVSDHWMIVSATQLMKIDKREFGHLEWGAGKE
jgi:hypothetical protein